MDRVLMAVDFSAASTEASRWLSHDFAPRSRVDLVHILRPLKSKLPLVRAFQSDEPPTAADCEAAAARLSELARSLDPRRPGSYLEIQGAPAELLVARAGRVEADLIAVADGPKLKLPSSLPGSMAARLIRCTNRPVLVARGPLAVAPRRILVCLTQARETNETWSWARYLAELHRAEIVVLHVENSWYANQLRQHLSERQGRAMQKDQKQQGRAFLTALVEQDLDELELRIMVRSGPTGAEILRVAAEVDADLVVCGLAGKGPGRPLIGSVARYVMEKCKASVLVVPEPVQPSIKRTDNETISGVGETPW